jgi:hypothetical protein
MPTSDLSERKATCEIELRRFLLIFQENKTKYEVLKNKRCSFLDCVFCEYIGTTKRDAAQIFVAKTAFWQSKMLLFVLHLL